jgi:hypothetical protein
MAMTPADDEELRRLGDLLQAIDDGLEPDSPLREALLKAGFALGLSFLRGMRADIERCYATRDQSLTDAQREHLRGLGLDPDE